MWSPFCFFLPFFIQCNFHSDIFKYSFPLLLPLLLLLLLLLLLFSPSPFLIAAGSSCAELSTKGAVTLSLSLSAVLLLSLTIACGRSRQKTRPNHPTASPTTNNTSNSRSCQLRIDYLFMPFLVAIADLTHPLKNNRSSIGMIGCYLL